MSQKLPKWQHGRPGPKSYPGSRETAVLSPVPERQRVVAWSRDNPELLDADKFGNQCPAFLVHLLQAKLNDLFEVAL